MYQNKVISLALDQYDSFDIPTTPSDNIEILDQYNLHLGKSMHFQDHDVLFIQHQLGSLPGRIRGMIDQGLNVDRTWVVDIPYSTHENVRTKLIDLGLREDYMEEIFHDPLTNYNNAQFNRVKSVMEKLESRENPRPLLVVDDGAYFARYLNYLNESAPNKLAHYLNSSVVEQTTRGHRYICIEALEVVMKCRLSVVSIARCKTKSMVEAPFIGASVSRSIINSLGIGRIIKAQRIAVLGIGVIGHATLKEMARIHPEASIDAIDLDETARDSASEISTNCNGLPQLRNDKEYDIVVGCTGYNSFHIDQRKLLADSSILISASSAAIEFNRSGFVKLADEYDDDEIEILDRENTVSSGIHAKIFMKQEMGKRFSIFNAGFPANFDGKIENMPEKMIHPTHALMYAASIQSLDQNYPGITSISPNEDEWIFNQAVTALRNSPELS